ncbi:hypothetical protein J1605_017842 [Eschrichtius robustus]|uniref:Uncharacterized protein n=1 Tax=Eschrichtius robustus TaxID=9764 RepID=A0AB34HZG6_ESCRO|nr:hypothetical protein J1605_017842 [Eschrichtius robustus]
MKEDYKSVEDTTGETFTEGEESYLGDDESYVEHLEGSSSSFQDDYVESIEKPQYMETPVPDAEEAEEEVKKKISESFFYDYMELASMPFVTPDSNIPLDLLTLVYPLQLHMYNLGISAF